MLIQEGRPLRATHHQDVRGPMNATHGAPFFVAHSSNLGPHQVASDQCAIWGKGPGSGLAPKVHTIGETSEQFVSQTRHNVGFVNDDPESQAPGREQYAYRGIASQTNDQLSPLGP